MFRGIGIGAPAEEVRNLIVNRKEASGLAG
jgi:hypothetical protein